jgi:hypothetical protein
MEVDKLYSDHGEAYGPDLSRSIRINLSDLPVPC